MKYYRSCSASGMFLSNNVIHEFKRNMAENMYNFKHVTKSNNLVVNHI